MISTYKPNVKCNQARSPPWRSVVNIFADMVATKDLMKFGRQGARDVDIDLPFHIRACKVDLQSLVVGHKC